MRPPRLLRLVTLAALAVAVLALSALGVVVAGPAAAHAALESTTPAAGSVVPAAPERVRLVFSEPVDVALGRIVVMGPDGHAAEAGPPAAGRSGPSGEASIALRGGLGRGTYLVSWRVVSADGHPVAGGFTFSIGAPSPLADVVPVGAGEAPVDPWVGAVVSAARYAGYVGLVLLAAAVVTATALRRAGLAPAGAWSLGRAGLAVLAGSTVVAVVVSVPYVTGGGLADLTWGGLTAQAGTLVQQALLARLVLLAAVWPVLRDLAAGPAQRPGGRAGAVALTVALVVTWPLSGHAGAGAGAVAWPVTTATESVHVAAMACWLGGLVAVARTLLPRARPASMVALLVVWPRWAIWSVGCVVLSGLGQAAVGTGSLAAVTDTRYGRLVLAKAAGTGVMLLAAGVAHRLVTRRLQDVTLGNEVREQVSTVSVRERVSVVERASVREKVLVPERGRASAATPTAVAADVTADVVPARGAQAEDGAPGPAQAFPEGTSSLVVRRLRAAVGVEIGLAAVVLALATTLVQTEPGRVAARQLSPAADLLRPPTPGAPVYGIERASGLVLQVDVAPLQVGRNTVLLTLIDDAGRPVAPQEWTVAVSLPTRQIRNVSVPVNTSMGTGVAYALPQLPVPGDWAVTVTVRTDDLRTVVMNRSIRVY